MFNFTKKKTIIGAIGLVLSVAVAAVCGGFGESGAIEDLTATGLALRLLSVSGIALAFGFVMLILFDWKFFVTVVGLFGIMILVQSTDAMAVSVGLAVISLLAAGGGIFGFTLQYRNCRYDLNGATTARERRNEQKRAELVQKMIEEDEALKSSIGYPEKSIMLWSSGGTLFQAIKNEREYLFHRIGNIYTKPDWSKCIVDFDNQGQYFGEKDYKIDMAEVESVQAVLGSVTMPYYGTLKIILRSGKKKNYGFVNFMEEDELKAFFGGDIEVKDKTKKAVNASQAVPRDKTEISDSHRAVLNKINLARYIFSVVSTLVFTAYVFYNTEKTDIFFTTLAILICLAPIVAYLTLQKYITIRDVGKFAVADKDKINFLFIVFIFPMLFAIKCMLTGFYTVEYDYLKLFLYSLIPLAVLSAVFFLTCKEWKKYKSCIVAFFVFAIAFCPSFIHKANRAFDFNEPQEITCQVTDMRATDGREPTYYLTIEYEGKTVEKEVGEATYEQMTVGGQATLLRYRGAFGIRYTYFKRS